MKKTTDNTLTYAEQLLWASDAARGVEHIHSKGIVHRDLAARNVLATLDVQSGCIRCKVADFGLAREVDDGYYLKKTERAKPVRWMAPETLQADAKFSSRSDVYSFAMVLLEIANGAKAPFTTIGSNSGVRDAVHKGTRPACPTGCTNELFQVMSRCWAGDPYDRLSMSQVVSRLQQLWQAEVGPTTPSLPQPDSDLPKTVQATVKLDEPDEEEPEVMFGFVQEAAALGNRGTAVTSSSLYLDPTPLTSSSVYEEATPGNLYEEATPSNLPGQEYDLLCGGAKDTRDSDDGQTWKLVLPSLYAEADAHFSTSTTLTLGDASPNGASTL